MLTAALIGLPLSGKTTFFRLLTRKIPGRRPDVDRAVVPVADPRLEVLAKAFHPRKVTPAQIAFWDVPGLREGAAQGDARRFLTEIRQADALIQVLGCFPEWAGPDPDAAAESLALELTVADLDVVERRLERLAKGKRKPEEERERQVLQKVRPFLEQGVPVRGAGLTAEESASLKSLALLTEKPIIHVLNTGEDGRPPLDPQRFGDRHQGPVVVASAALEAEIAELPPEDRRPFLASMGFAEPGLDRLTRACYRCLGLISFLTAGEDEVRAWTVQDGQTAREAAAKIHSDIARGFIRAEVVSFEHFVQDDLSLNIAKERGHWRLEGKDYPVQDGDIINFRFHI